MRRDGLSTGPMDAAGAVRRVPDPPTARSGWHGSGHARPRHAARPRGRGEVPLRPPRQRAGAAARLDRGARRRAAAPPERGDRLPRRRAGRAALPRLRVRARRAPRQAPAAGAVAPDPRDRGRPGPRAGRGAPPWRAPPRPQAGQRHPGRKRRGEAARLRARQAGRDRGRDGHRGGLAGPRDRGPRRRLPHHRARRSGAVAARHRARRPVGPAVAADRAGRTRRRCLARCHPRRHADGNPVVHVAGGVARRTLDAAQRHLRARRPPVQRSRRR